jgi:hypothetical protein
MWKCRLITDTSYTDKVDKEDFKPYRYITLKVDIEEMQNKKTMDGAKSVIDQLVEEFKKATEQGHSLSS